MAEPDRTFPSLPGEFVIALHCSGADARQWQSLAETLAPGCELLTPEHFGCDAVGPWTGAHAFTLADEAARTIAIIDRINGPVHLVGHSYGGAVALHIALARSERIASLSLYEPTAFHMLWQLGPRGAAALADVTPIAQAVGAGVLSGDYREAAELFINYWSGEGAWQALRPSLQNAITRWMPKGPLDFAALLKERASLGEYKRIKLPVLVLRGEHAPTPTRIIADALPSLLPHARVAVIAGAGHMGPLTHAAEVNAAIVRHIAGEGRRSERPACAQPVRTTGGGEVQGAG